MPRYMRRRRSRRPRRRSRRRPSRRRATGLMSRGGHQIVPMRMTKPFVSYRLSNPFVAVTAKDSGSVLKLNLNDLSTPQANSGINRPYGVDQLGAFYDKYRVGYAKWRIQFRPNVGVSTADHNGFYFYWYYGNVGATPVGSVTPESLRNCIRTDTGEKVYWKFVPGFISTSTSMPYRPITLSGSKHIWKIVGHHWRSRKEYQEDANTEAAFTTGSIASPTFAPQLHVGIISANEAVWVANEIDFFAQVSMTQYAYLHERINIAQAVDPSDD